VRLGIEQATDQLVHLGDRPGAAHRGRKLRIWFGHVRQRDRICGELLARVWAEAPARWRTADLDSTICGELPGPAQRRLRRRERRAAQHGEQPGELRVIANSSPSTSPPDAA
jgi:hypothetical protein